MKKCLLLSLLFYLYVIPSSFSQATISGRVFNDVTNNGAYDAGEELNNISIWLLDLNAVAPNYRVSPVQTAITNSSGIFTFTNVPASDYQVRVMQSTIPSSITRAVYDNDAYPNGLTNIMGVSGTNSYTNIDFGFAATATVPSFTSQRNFQWDVSNTFINTSSQTYNLTPETIGGIPVSPTITWTTDRTSAPGGGYGTDTYPQASYSTAVLGQGFPGNNKGGVHGADNTFQLIFGGGGYNPVNNDLQTTTIQFNVPVVNTKFSIYDIDHSDPQRASGRIDHIKVTGYRGAIPVLPVLINPSAAPWNTVSGNTVYGFADYPLINYTVPFNSQNEDHGTINVYFQTTIDKIVIEYEEWAPVMLIGKGILDATPANLAASESIWVDRSGTNAPNYRGISIGSVDYTVDAGTILPLQLKSFQASGKNCIGLLNWETVLEQNLDYFEIEYAANGNNFQPIAKVNPANSINGSKYSFIVPESSAAGYYKLKISDLNGKFQYSEIRLLSIQCNNNISWSLTPNPANADRATTLNVFVKNSPLKKATVICRDMNGRPLLQQSITLQPGQSSFILKTQALKAGTYIFGLYDNNNKIAGEVQKLIIQ